MRDYFQVGTSPLAMKKIIVRWDGFEEGYMSDDGLYSDLDAVVSPVLGAKPRYWSGIIEAGDSADLGEEYMTVADLVDLAVRIPFFYLIAQFEDVPVPVMWAGNLNIHWMSTEVRRAEIPFVFIEVLL